MIRQAKRTDDGMYLLSVKYGHYGRSANVALSLINEMSKHVPNKDYQQVVIDEHLSIQAKCNQLPKGFELVDEVGNEQF